MAARLLWRGAIALPLIDTDNGISTLDGLAMVASSFSLPGAATPGLGGGGGGGPPSSAAGKDDDNDPFSAAFTSSSPTKSADATAAELCLDLEMLRNCPLALVRRVRIASSSSSIEDAPSTTTAVVEPKVHGRRALKRSIEMLSKGKQRASTSPAKQNLELVYLDLPSPAHATEGTVSPTPDNISLHIDERCTATVDYFSRLFCRDKVDPGTGRTTIGIVLSLGGLPDAASFSGGGGQATGAGLRDNAEKTTVVVYGKLEEDANRAQRQVMRLYVARQKSRRRELAPRPDDPAPRGVFQGTRLPPLLPLTLVDAAFLPIENLFAQKLRRAVSQPVLSLTNGAAASTSARQSGANGTNSKRPPLTNAATSLSQIRTLQRNKAKAAVSEAGSSTSAAGPLSKARNPFSRSASLGTAVGESGAAGPNSEPPSRIHASPGRRGQKRPRLTAGGLRALQEEAEDDEGAHSHSFDERMTGVKREAELVVNDEEEGRIIMDALHRAREHSPTPSAASARSFKTSLSVQTMGAGTGTYTTAPANGRAVDLARGKSTLGRSMSLPPGQLALGMKHAPNGKGMAQQRARENSIAPTEGTAAVHENGDDSGNPVEMRNKGVSALFQNTSTALRY